VRCLHVHLNGEPVRSCSVPVSAAADQKVLTIEGLAQRGQLHPVQKAWIDHEVRSAATASRGRSWRRSPCSEESRPQRQGHRRGDDQHLPLRNLCAHSHGDPRRGEDLEVDKA